MAAPWHKLITPELEAEEGPFAPFAAWESWMNSTEDGEAVLDVVRDAGMDVVAMLFSRMEEACAEATATGTYYTPPAVVDMACGSGAFLADEPVIVERQS